MKKLLIFFTVLFILSGCDNNETETLSCSSTTRQNGIVTRTRYDFKYLDDEVKHVTITYDYSQEENGNAARDIDGVDADTDGLDEDTDTNNNGNIDSDDVVDGVVGDTIDEAVDTVTDTILDLSGIRNTFENQMTDFDDIEGFSYEVDTDSNNEYKVIYEIDMDKISDADLARIDVDRDFSNITNNYEDLGYTCR